jgi:hypothetical protein
MKRDRHRTARCIPQGLLIMKNRQQQLSEKAGEERRRCRDWLLKFMQADQPKFLTKDELRAAAMRELNVSKLSFDMGWIMAIEDTGRHDWYEPLRRRSRTRN